MIEEESRICINCVKNKELKKYFKNSNLDIGECLICGEHQLSIDIEKDLKIVALLKALIRYYYNEGQYNEIWGGYNLYDLLQEDNPILKNEFKYPQCLDVIVIALKEDSYVTSKNGIPLYRGYDLHSGYFAMNLQEENSVLINGFEERLKKENQFKVEGDALNLIRRFEKEITSFIDQSKELFRARIGYDQKIFNHDMDSMDLTATEEREFFVPFIDEQIGSPPPPKAQPARLSRAGISYVYLASKKDTAIAEIRPHPGHYISVGKFRLNGRLKFADFRNISIMDFFESEDDIENFLFLNNIGKKLSIPITPEEREKYLFTQFITEVIRQAGFVGVIFKSSVGNGHNVVVFDSDNVEYLEGTGEVIEVESLKYKIINRQVENSPNKVTHTVI
ncbi:RES family NAD+ phosphorylase [Metabacillus idriensis]|uniref:RES family NAD+ phosphorylase n=1 Tax=Metabacillus idriensis TaxID=324768 RepID=UPI00203B5C18|nr:RES family NAD+ phosphorylase [Metabacillus idriensis]MCM3595043.1 RES family NAD+ phosphorylase [Metabacillus idriensis]